MIGDALLELVRKDASLRRRIFGVAPVATTAANMRFVARFREVFPDAFVSATNGPNTTYDAFYLLAFASYAVPPNEPITGPTLARSLAKLQPPGPKIEAGLGGIFDAYQELSAGRTIDFVGATGNMDFDLATGEPSFDQAILCVATDPTGKAIDGVESGLVYSAAQHALLGGPGMSCP